MSPASNAVIVIVAILLGLFSLALFVGLIWNIRTEALPQQKLFAAGTLPGPLPDGFYQGHITNYQGAWRGKNFNLATKTGQNHFAGDQIRDPFVFSVSPSVHNARQQVVKLDYNIPQNPFWLRHLVDEIVQTSPGHYLGKIYVRVIGLSFTTGYFSLEK